MAQRPKAKLICCGLAPNKQSVILVFDRIDTPVGWWNAMIIPPTHYTLEKLSLYSRWRGRLNREVGRAQGGGTSTLTVTDVLQMFENGTRLSRHLRSGVSTVRRCLV